MRISHILGDASRHCLRENKRQREVEEAFLKMASSTLTTEEVIGRFKRLRVNRLYHLSPFAGELIQRFSHWYHCRGKRNGLQLEDYQIPQSH